MMKRTQNTKDWNKLRINKDDKGLETPRRMVDSAEMKDIGVEIPADNSLSNVEISIN